MPRKDLNKFLLNKAKESEKVIPWSDLDQKTFYEVVNVSQPFDNKFSQSHILSLKSLDDDSVVKVFSISRLPVDDFGDDSVSHYIKSNGLKPCDDGKRKYYDFTYFNDEK